MAAESLTTNDVFQTSSGVGHHWRPGYYFPSSRHQVRLDSLHVCVMHSPAVALCRLQKVMLLRLSHKTTM